MVLSPRHFRIFLSSPGDVGDERALVRGALEQLQYDPLLQSRVTLQTVSWDDPRAQAPMLASLTPQQAISRHLPRPSECDVTIVILWSRMGTVLTGDDGAEYRSGTEWEFYDALRAGRETLVYRRTARVEIDSDDPEAEEKLLQKKRVNEFFESLRNPDGSRKAVSSYEFPTQLCARVANDLKFLIRHEWDEAAASSVATPAWAGCPFPGLRAFHSNEATIFCGRALETDQLVERLRDPDCRFLVLLGSSGSGKSSLVAAGLLPRIQANAIPGSKDWRVLRCRPGASAGGDPFLSLAASAADLRGDPACAPDLAIELCRGANGMASLRTQLLDGRPRWSELLLVIDQLEELFVFADVHKRCAFVSLLVSATALPRVRVVATMRAEFVAQCLESPELVGLFQRGSYLLAPPSTVGLHEMITRPAQLAAVRLEAGLVERILTDAGGGSGALPLVAYTLVELYDIAQGGELTHEAYRQIGGIRGAVSERAERMYAELEPEARCALAPVFRRLVSVNESGVVTSRRLPRASVEASAGAARLITALIEARLLVSGRSGDTAVIEVAHETVLHGWTRLAETISQDITFLTWRKRLEQARAEWERMDREPGTLLRGAPLAEAEQWLLQRLPDLAPPDIAFIRESLSLQTRDVEAAQRELQIHLSRQLAAQSHGLADESLDLALLLADEANKAALTFEARSALFTALHTMPQLIAYLREATPSPLSGARYPRWCACVFHPTQRTLFALGRRDDAVIRAWDLDTIRSVEIPLPELNLQDDEEILSLAIDSRGEALAIGTEHGRVFLMDGRTYALRSALEDPAGSAIVMLRFVGAQCLLAGYTEYSLWNLGAQQRPAKHFERLHKVDRNVLASVHGDLAVIRELDQNEETILHRMDAQTGESREFSIQGRVVALDPSGRYMAVRESADRVEIMRVASDESLAHLATVPVAAGRGRAFALHDDGLLAMSGPSDFVTARPPDYASSFCTSPHRLVESLAIDPRGEMAVTLGHEDSMVLWSLSDRRSLGRCLANAGEPPRVAFVADGSVVVASGHSNLTCWNVSTGGKLAEWQLGHDDCDLAVSTDGRFVASHAGGGAVLILDSQHMRAWITDTSEPLACVGFVPQTHRLALALADGGVRFWDCAENAAVGPVWHPMLDACVEALTFTRRGDTYAALHADGGIELRDTSTGLLRGGPIQAAEVTSYANHLLFDASGQFLFVPTPCELLSVYDVGSRRLIRRFGPGGDIGASVRMAQDPVTGLVACACDFYPSIALLDAKCRQLLGPAIGRDSDVTGLCFHPRGKLIASGHENGDIVVWDMDLESWRRRARRIANRRLSEAEHAQYLAPAMAGNTNVLAEQPPEPAGETTA